MWAARKTILSEGGLHSSDEHRAHWQERETRASRDIPHPHPVSLPIKKMELEEGRNEISVHCPRDEYGWLGMWMTSTVTFGGVRWRENLYSCLVWYFSLKIFVCVFCRWPTSASCMPRSSATSTKTWWPSSAPSWPRVSSMQVRDGCSMHNHISPHLHLRRVSPVVLLSKFSFYSKFHLAFSFFLFEKYLLQPFLLFLLSWKNFVLFRFVFCHLLTWDLCPCDLT